MRLTAVEEEGVAIACKECEEVLQMWSGGHYKNTCRNLRADFDADYEGDVVVIDNLLDRNYPPCL